VPNKQVDDSVDVKVERDTEIGANAPAPLQSSPSAPASTTLDNLNFMFIISI